MLRIDVQFDISKKVSEKIQQALRSEIEKKILSNYERGVVKISKSSSNGVSISGVDDEEKKIISQKLEEIWADDSWLSS